jgi:hypothetical protein
MQMKIPLSDIPFLFLLHQSNLLKISRTCAFVFALRNKALEFTGWKSLGRRVAVMMATKRAR